MPNVNQICLVLVLMACALFSTAAAQDSTTAKSILTITANATGDAVRITAPSSVVEMHVEVYASSGEKLFDQEIRGGNVFDWHLQDSQAQRLAAGAYVCVVTAKSVSGRITQKLGTVDVTEKSASVTAGSLQLSPQQTQAIGAVEADSSWTIAGENEPQTPTVIAHDGTDGQMIRGRGALTFRVGNFFSGIDTEQMRLTEAGDLGIGTSTPQAKLEVAGAIRAERFLIVKPGKSGGDKTMVANATTDARDSVQPLVGGGGTTGRLTKWTDGSSGTLGDSVITETVAGNIGIGTTSPQGALHLRAGLNKNIWFRDAGPTQRAQIISVADDNGTINTLSLDAAPLILNSQSSSNVGVGTTAPQARLDIEAIDGVGSQATEVLRIGKGTMDAGGDEAYINFVNASNTLGRVGVVAEGPSTGDLYLSVANAGAVSKALIAKFNGKVGIGTTNPVSKLDVAGDINTSSDYNIGGSRALSVAGTNNVFAGVNAGNNNTGSDNSFFGRGAGFKNTTGSGNSFFGSQAGNQDMEGINNSFFGAAAGFNTIHDSSNTGFTDNDSFFGAAAGYSNTTGGHNAFFGDGAGFNNTTGGSNAFFGSLAGSISTGEQDTFVGANSGNNNRNGNYNTLIGSLTDVGSGNLNHATAIGAESSISTSNSISLGRSDGSDTVYVWGVLRTGLDGSGSLDVCRNTDLRLSTCSSSLRYKTGIQPFTRGLDVVRRLRPITFNWKDGGMSDVGFGSEDVEQVEPLLATRNDRGEIEGVKYKQITTVLVNAIKEQQDQIAALRTANKALNARLQHIEGTLRKKRGSSKIPAVGSQLKAARGNVAPASAREKAEPWLRCKNYQKRTTALLRWTMSIRPNWQCSMILKLLLEAAFPTVWFTRSSTNW